MTITSETTAEFFDRYAAALLARDEAAIAGLYAVPSLILFPGQSIAVTDTKQTEQFFAASWSQYEGVHTIDKTITTVLEGPGTVWADVTWFYGSAREHFCLPARREPQRAADRRTHPPRLIRRHARPREVHRPAARS